MVCQVTKENVRTWLHETADPLLLESVKHWAPIDLDYLADTFEKILGTPAGLALGFSDKGKCTALVLGLVVPDMVSGHLQGLVCHWGSQPGRGAHGLRVFKHFERACKKLGCETLVAGCISDNGSAPKMRTLYSKLGFLPHREEFLKKL